MSLEITITENVTNAALSANVTTVTVSNVGIQGPAGEMVGGTADYAYLAGTSVYATTAGTSIYALTSGTSVYATNAGTSIYATTAGTSVYATNAGTAVWADGTDRVEQYVKAGTTIGKGKAVYITGSTGSNAIIGLAKADSDTTSSKTLGLSASSLATNDFGYVITEGLIEGVDTSTAVAGDPVWLSPTTAGGLIFGQSNKPVAPNHSVYIGVVVRVNQNNGAIFVKVQNGYELQELHNVLITSVANNDVLKYDIAAGVWVNSASAPLAGTATYATLAGTATYATTSGTATYATTSGTAAYTIISGTATYATTSGTAAYATTSGTATYATAAGTATTAGTASYAITSGTATYATTSGTAVNISGTIAPSQVTGTAATLGTANTFTTGVQTIKTGADGTRALDLWRNSATQTANLFTIYMSNGTTELAKFDSAGALSVATDTSGTAVFINATNTSAVHLVIQGPASNTGDLQRWRTSSATVASVSSSGALTLSPASGTAATINAAASAIALKLQGAASQNIQEWWISGGSTFSARVDANGNWRSAYGLFSRSTTNGGSGDEVHFILQAASTQTAQMMQVQNNSGTVLGGIASLGEFFTGSTAPIQVSSVNSQLSVTSNAAGVVGLVVKAAASQTADVFTIVDSSNVNKIRVNSSWDFDLASGGTYRTSGFGFFRPENSGHSLVMTKQTAAATNRGAGNATLYFRDGTNTGTLKLVVRAGTAGAETTILDNIPTT